MTIAFRKYTIACVKFEELVYRLQTQRPLTVSA